MKLTAIFSIVLLVGSAQALFFTQAKPKLGKYNFDTGSVTVSGISSGGAMAMQYHVSYSSEVKGAAIFAGGPYLCAAPGLFTASICMLTPALVDVGRLVETTLKRYNNGKIDNPANLQGENAWIFHGTEDTVIGPASGRKIAEFYEKFGTQVSTVFDIPAAHGFPTENDGAKCGVLNPPTFINNCSFNGAFESLNAMYGNSLTRPTGKVGTAANIVDFSQFEFDNIITRTLDDDGYLYVPKACRDGATQCRLHVAFHGCLSSITYVKYGYATETGYMDVAEENNIIILFPQVGTLLNPSHCWDWFGYTGLNYANKDGHQMKGVNRMIKRMITG